MDELALFFVLVEISSNRTEAQRVHDGERTRAHGEDIAKDSADPCGCALMRFDVAGVVVRFDFESACPSVAHIDDAGVFTRTLDDAVALCRQSPEVHARRLVGAVLAPHHAVDTEFSKRWSAAKSGEDAVVLLRGDVVRGQ